MGNTICCVPADSNGNKLWLKDFKKEGKKLFIKYRSTFNDIPFRETEIYLVDNDQNLVISGDDGTVIFRFSVNWINQFVN